MIVLAALVGSFFASAITIGGWFSIAMLFGMSTPTEDQVIGVCLGLAVLFQIGWIAIFAWEEFRS